MIFKVQRRFTRVSNVSNPVASLCATGAVLEFLRVPDVGGHAAVLLGVLLPQPLEFTYGASCAGAKGVR
jgi:hypothetical protein